jgi:hypothetical protein
VQSGRAYSLSVLVTEGIVGSHPVGILAIVNPHDGASVNMGILVWQPAQMGCSLVGVCQSFPVARLEPGLLLFLSTGFLAKRAGQGDSGSSTMPLPLQRDKEGAARR